MQAFRRLYPAMIAVGVGVGTAYYVVAPEYADGGLGAEVIPESQRKNVPVSPIGPPPHLNAIPPLSAAEQKHDCCDHNSTPKPIDSSFGSVSGGEASLPFNAGTTAVEAKKSRWW
ncbi:hypothetical protein L202_01598 [Cryptococcus amylolentus CBS 6039]|uniref:Uncharacterized protein n=1 Tax=Cryptococcus amylolentus CBS 6039 TaxID=1295533 RepID=A0A1E3I6M5_9TREE|nr:hypothetical protein L202_01598 [Cryptococcus amylolentus CBS 6039]ODN83461.1 hypothetical protein L202_01598 [Cryptococcus amylolentus CBS 6039]